MPSSLARNVALTFRKCALCFLHSLPQFTSLSKKQKAGGSPGPANCSKSMDRQSEHLRGGGLPSPTWPKGQGRGASLADYIQHDADMLPPLNVQWAFAPQFPYLQNRNDSTCLPGVFGELIQAQLLEHEPHSGIKYTIKSADNINVIPIRSYTTPTLVQ